MKYFTPELIERLGSPDPAIASQADAEWDRRQEYYERALEILEARMSAHMREFSQLLLHDARVCGIARREGELTMVLQKVIPPQHLVILTYDLVGELEINPEAHSLGAGSEMPVFEYDELEGEEKDGRFLYRQSILFSNGWEMRLTFNDVRYVLADTLTTGPVLSCLTRSA